MHVPHAPRALAWLIVFLFSHFCEFGTSNRLAVDSAPRALWDISLGKLPCLRGSVPTAAHVARHDPTLDTTEAVAASSLLTVAAAVTETGEQVALDRDPSGFLHLSIANVQSLPETAEQRDDPAFYTAEAVASSLLTTASADVPEATAAPTSAETGVREKPACVVPPSSEFHTGSFHFNSSKELLESRGGAGIDVAIIPSGGLVESGAPHTFVTERLDQAAQLANATRYFLSSGAYTPLKAPILSSTGHPLTEAHADAEYLVSAYGIPRNVVILEEMSRDTLGNAFFSRILCDLMRFQNIVVVTNRFHMTRTRATFEWVFNLPGPRYTPIHFLEVRDAGLDPTALQVRVDKERNSLEHFWCNVRSQVKTMEELSKFIYLGHRAYAFDKETGSYNVQVPKEALKSY